MNPVSNDMRVPVAAAEPGSPSTARRLASNVGKVTLVGAAVLGLATAGCIIGAALGVAVLWIPVLVLTGATLVTCMVALAFLGAGRRRHHHEAYVPMHRDVDIRSRGHDPIIIVSDPAPHHARGFSPPRESSHAGYLFTDTAPAHLARERHSPRRERGEPARRGHAGYAAVHSDVPLASPSRMPDPRLDRGAGAAPSRAMPQSRAGGSMRDPRASHGGVGQRA